jgi:hypothetical protein
MRQPQLNAVQKRVRRRSGAVRPVLWALSIIVALAVLGTMVYVMESVTKAEADAVSSLKPRSVAFVT